MYWYKFMKQLAIVGPTGRKFLNDETISAWKLASYLTKDNLWEYWFYFG